MRTIVYGISWALALSTTATAGNLLEDPSLELATPGTQTSNSAWVLDVNFPDGINPAAQFQEATWASFPADEAGVGLWYRSFEGEQSPGDPAATAILYQDVPGTEGVEYEVIAMYKEEAFYTAKATLLGLRFYSAGMTLLGSQEIDVALSHPGDGSWVAYATSAVAPAGTATVRVFAEMVDGLTSPDNPQSAFFDAFALYMMGTTPVDRASWGEVKSLHR